MNVIKVEFFPANYSLKPRMNLDSYCRELIQTITKEQIESKQHIQTFKTLYFIHQLSSNGYIKSIIKNAFLEFFIDNNQCNVVSTLYDNLETSIKITDEERTKMNIIHDEVEEKNKKWLEQLRNKVSYDAKELIGAKDKFGKWWAAYILDKFIVDKRTIYHVEFINWGVEFREFIEDSYTRMEKYKPYKHKLYQKKVPSKVPMPILDKYNNDIVDIE
jgi:hypothetical protein